MLTVEQARQTILDTIHPLPAVSLPAAAALHCVLAEDVVSGFDIPPFDNSAMDGYAVRAAELADASAGKPVTLQLQGELPAGAVAAEPLRHGGAIRIFTGAPVPPGADAVVMKEDTRPEGDRVVVLDSVRLGENIRRAGEDIAKGAVVLRRGMLLGPAHLGVAASVGRTHLGVFRRPRVAILPTGAELVPAGQPIGPGQIHDSNTPTVTALLTLAGCEPAPVGIVVDEEDATRDAIAGALARSDALITTGGVSVGEYDFVKEALASLGADTKLWKVAMKPGKPLVFSLCSGKPVFGLPGNPVSVVVTFVLMVLPALQKMRGLTGAALDLPTEEGVAGEPLANKGDRRIFIRARARREGQRLLVRPTGSRQQSHILSGLLDANCLVDLPAGALIPAGGTLQVIWMPAV